MIAADGSGAGRYDCGMPDGPPTNSEPDASPASPATPVRRLPWLLVGWGLALVVLAGVGFYGVWRAVPAKDFSLFYDAAWYWVHHGEPGGLAWYHPFALRCFSPMGYGPPWVGGTVWVLGNLACGVGAAWLVGRWYPPAHGGWLRTEAGPALALGAAWFVELAVNQFVPPILLLVVLALFCLERGRDELAGLALGVAALLKLSPVLLIGWLLLARRWRAFAAAVGTVLLLGPGLDVLFVGWEHALRWQLDWFTRVRWSGSAWTVLVAGSQCEYSNHAVPAVLRRLLHPTDSTPYYDVEVGGQLAELGGQSVHLVELPISGVIGVWAAFMALGLGGLALATAWPWRRLPPERARWELALWSWGMLWFLPVVRQYHYIWAYPLLSLLIQELRLGWAEGLRSARARVAAAGVGVWALTMLASAPRFAQEIGVPLLGLASVGAAGVVIVCLRWGARGGGALETWSTGD